MFDTALTDHLWLFSHCDGRTINRYVRLRADGTLGGTNHPNETSWRIDDSALLLCDPNGSPTSRLEPDQSGGFEGPFVGQPDIRLRLQPTDLEYPMVFHWNGECERVLASKPVFLAHIERIGGVLHTGHHIHIGRRIAVEPEATMPAGKFFPVGAYSYFGGNFDGQVEVGRYSCIAGGCSVMGDRHPMDRVSMHPFTYYEQYPRAARDRYGVEFEGEPFDRLQPPITIGNDVWVGQEVLFAGGVTVGDGAMIAARAVVTKDVPPFTVVGGVPARPIRSRFPPATIERLQRSRWWDYNFVDLPRSWSEPERFLDELDDLVAHDAIRPWRPAPIDLGRELLWASLG